MRARIALRFGFVLALAGCAPATTGVAIEVYGADATDANQLRVTGSLGDDRSWHPPSDMTRVPADDGRRPLAAVEDVRILVPDEWADKTLFVNVQLFHDDQPARTRDGAVVPPYDGGAVLVGGRTKRIRACFTGLACPPPSGM